VCGGGGGDNNLAVKCVCARESQKRFKPRSMEKLHREEEDDG
jgi:hypothetical protein